MIEDLSIALVDEEECDRLKEDSQYVIYKDTGAGVGSLVTL